MRPITLTLAATLLASPISVAAADNPYHLSEAVSDELLSTTFGTASPAFPQNVRLMTDANAQLYLQQAGAGSRIAMDNWWSQTGAALIVDNVLASTLR